MEANFEFKLEQDIAKYDSKLSEFYRKRHIFETNLGKLEREMRPLVKRITMLRAIYHSTEKDQSTQARMYRDFILLETRRSYEEYVSKRKEFDKYEKLIHQTNHDFVEGVTNAPK